MPSPGQSTRLPGLDSLRALAILLVLIYHYKVVVSREPLFGFVSNLGWVGVDLFFVLSGYLIGNQVLGEINKSGKFSLGRFYARRLLRTLPNYYVVLASYFIFAETLSGTASASLWSFLTFVQNIGMQPGQTFTHSWSLCIEEQFYILFPLLAIFLLKILNSRSAFWLCFCALALSAMALRYWNWSTLGEAQIPIMDYYEHIYYSSFTRFDELLPGIAIAALKNFHPSVFNNCLKRGNWILILGLIACFISLFGFHNYWFQKETGVSAFWTSAGYSLIAWSFALLLLAALAPGNWLARTRIPGAMQLALWSYAIYLVHKPLYLVLKTPLKNWGINTDNYIGMALIVSASITLGWLLFRAVETPFMRWRDSHLSLTHKANNMSDNLEQAKTQS